MAKEEVAAHKHADLEKELAALKKELAALKKDLAATKKLAEKAGSSKSSGGADPRLDAFLNAFRNHTSKWKNILEKAGL